MQLSFFGVQERLNDSGEILNKTYVSAMLCSSARGHLQIVESKIKAMICLPQIELSLEFMYM